MWSREIRIETILPAFRKSTVTRALLSVHPYEEPVFDFYPLDNAWNQVGSGVVGELPEEEERIGLPATDQGTVPGGVREAFRLDRQADTRSRFMRRERRFPDQRRNQLRCGRFHYGGG